MEEEYLRGFIDVTRFFEAEVVEIENVNGERTKGVFIPIEKNFMPTTTLLSINVIRNKYRNRKRYKYIITKYNMFTERTNESTLRRYLVPNPIGYLYKRGKNKLK